MGWFHELSARRGAGMSGPLPISYEQIKAWSTLMNEHPTPNEVRMILYIDDCYRSTLAKELEGMRDDK